MINEVISEVGDTSIARLKGYQIKFKHLCWRQIMLNKKNIYFLVTIILSGCMGRAPNPISVKNIDDENFSCDRIKIEISTLEEKIRRLIPDTEKTGSNVALGAAGLLFLPLWCFMDLSDAEKVEIEACRDRIGHLTSLYKEKKCSTK